MDRAGKMVRTLFERDERRQQLAVMAVINVTVSDDVVDQRFDVCGYSLVLIHSLYLHFSYTSMQGGFAWISLKDQDPK